MLRRLGLLIAVVSLLGSCVMHKNTLLLQETSDVTADSSTYNIVINKTDYHVQVGDFIGLNVINPDKESVEIFKKEGTSLFETAYLVRNDGTIKMPFIGSINVLYMTLFEIEKMLEEQLSKYFKFVTVNVTLVNFKVTFLGEVGNQGPVQITNEKTNFFDAMSMAGGPTQYTNTKKVKLLRKVGDKVTIHYLDISTTEFLSSEFYYLRPDDIIYFEPLRGKTIRSNITIVSFGLSLISIIVTLSFRINRN